MAEDRALPFFWRENAANEDPAKWRYETQEWTSGTISSLRRVLAPEFGSSVYLVSEPRLTECDAEGRPTHFVNDEPGFRILSWTPATFPREYLQKHSSGRFKYVLLFTFPPGLSSLGLDRRGEAAL